MNEKDGPVSDRIPMARLASLFVLLAIICAVGFVFLRVMSGFWLPLFLAALLVVIFGPVHQWILDACEGKQKRAAVLTTAAILLAVLGPLVWVGAVAVDEARGLLTRNWANDVSDIESRASGLRTRLNLEMPYGGTGDGQLEKEQPFVEIEDAFERLRSQPESGNFGYDVERAACEQLVTLVEKLQTKVVDELRRQFSVGEGLDGRSGDKDTASDREFLGRVYLDLTGRPPTDVEVERFADDASTDKRSKLIEVLSESDSEFFRRVILERTGQPPSADELQSFLDDPSADKRRRLVISLYEADEANGNPLPVMSVAGRSQFESLKQQISAAHRLIIGKSESGEVSVVAAREFRHQMETAELSFQRMKQRLLGGPVRAWLIGLANPSAAQLQTWQSNVLGYVRHAVFSLTGQTTTFVGSLVFGLFILIIALYYFLIDGPSLIRAAMRLSPLDDKYEAELFAEFANMSRAVVLATLLSAGAQAILAGIGYAVVGAHPLFLLTVVTGLLAMVPFVGAAAVWLPVALWVAFVDQAPGAVEAGRLIPGIGLAIYGGVVVSMADNFIKPWVLHGQSNLHPLLALLSVLGGVKALGPVGLLVGPMIVSFLQALLSMLNAELGDGNGDLRANVEVVRRSATKKTSQD